ncbi:DUF1217 domain-containing protein [Bosea vaviloviae]|nr:DUF1217 domain-containing protein [Bosea vaviloviae]
MTTTMIAYQAVTRNLTQSLARTAAKPDVASHAAYFEKNIGKVKTLDDFMKDDRLYRYAVEAFGLGDMAYAKAFMRKVLAGGVKDSNSFANKLTDPRYRELAATFDFSTETADTTYFQTNIGKVKTVTSFTDKSASRMFDYAIKAFGLESVVDTPKEKEAVTQALHLGKDSPLHFADPAIDKQFRAFLKAFDFADKGAKATSDKAMMQQTVDRHNAAVRSDQTKTTVEKYTRQKLEQDAGASDDSVRLALYFERKAPTIKTAYQILADAALLKVVQTALGIPSETSAMPIDKQATMIEKKLDLKTLQDPDGLKRFMQRFTSLAGAGSGASSNPTMLLFSQPSSALIGQDVLASLQKLRLGGI